MKKLHDKLNELDKEFDRAMSLVNSAIQTIEEQREVVVAQMKLINDFLYANLPIPETSDGHTANLSPASPDQPDHHVSPLEMHLPLE